MYNYIEYMLLPAEAIQRNDNIAIVNKTIITPLEQTVQDTRPILQQGKKKGKKELSLSDKKLKLLEIAEKELKDLLQGLETISAALDYTSPSYWINLNGGNLNTALALGLDMVTYVALGGLPGLTKRGLVTLTKKGIKAAPNLLERLPSELTQADLKRYGAFKITTQSLPATPLPKGYRVPLEIEVSPIRELLINYYYSPEYKRRLLKAGFSELEASKRVEALIRNTNTQVLNKDLQGAAGLTEIDITSPDLVHIYIDGSFSEQERKAAILEELVHASELRGLTLQEIMKNPNYWKLSDEQKKTIITELTELNNTKAAAYNRTLQPEINLNITAEAQEYFKYPYET